MIRLTHTDGKAIYFAPELITTIKIKNGYTHIWSTDVSQPAPVTEPPEEVVRKVLEWRLAMERYKAIAKALASASENLNAYNNELDEEEKTLLVLAGLEGPKDGNEKEDLKWMLECPKYGEPCYCKEECMYLRQKSLRELDVIVAEKVMQHESR